MLIWWCGVHAASEPPPASAGMSACPPPRIPDPLQAIRELHKAHKGKSEKNDDPWWKTLAEGVNLK